MICIERLEKFYGKVAALKGIDLAVPCGELFAFLGPNGAGKTTTIRILTGLTRLSAGKAMLNGHDIETQTLAAKHQYGLVPQHINLDSELTVVENLLIHGRLHHMSRSTIGERIDQLLGYVELSDRRDSLIKNLSGGLKRRVMIARAMLHDPKILFLDEPTVGLDPNIRRRIWALIKKNSTKWCHNFSYHPLHRRGRISGRAGGLYKRRCHRGFGYAATSDERNRPLGHG
jgi:ABC-2 type transport system ATP-binding protein